MLLRSAALLLVLLAAQDCWAGCPLADVGSRQRRSLQSVQDLDHQVISERRSLLSYDLKAAETLAAINWQSVKVGWLCVRLSGHKHASAHVSIQVLS
jgi:hypothetical protein